VSAVGPVCHIAPVTTITPKVPVDIPAAPPPAQATLASLQQTVNTLREIIIITTGQQGWNGQPGANGSPGQPAPGGSFKQTSVTMQTQRVYQNNDPSTGNYVDVQYVSQLVMGNNSTKSTWTYNAPPPNQ
jgi:hypothetical protein